MTVNINDTTREALLFTLAELTDAGSITLTTDAGQITINSVISSDRIAGMLYVNELREQLEQRQRATVNRYYVANLHDKDWRCI